MDLFRMPHVRYLSDPANKNPMERSLHYLGGEVDKSLTIGEVYKIGKALYAEHPEDRRKKVWICNDDNGKVCQTTYKNFGDIRKVRDKKINKILK